MLTVFAPLTSVFQRAGVLGLGADLGGDEGVDDGPLRELSRLPLGDGEREFDAWMNLSRKWSPQPEPVPEPEGEDIFVVCSGFGELLLMIEVGDRVIDVGLIHFSQVVLLLSDILVDREKVARVAAGQESETHISNLPSGPDPRQATVQGAQPDLGARGHQESRCLSRRSHTFVHTVRRAT